jgi:hypothetical protein
MESFKIILKDHLWSFKIIYKWSFKIFKDLQSPRPLGGIARGRGVVAGQ